MHLNKEQQALINRAADIFGHEPEDVMDDGGCEECNGCSIRHAIKAMVFENPARLSVILDQISDQYKSLKERSEALMAQRDKLGEELDSMDAKTIELLSKKNHLSLVN